MLDNSKRCGAAGLSDEKKAVHGSAELLCDDSEHFRFALGEGQAHGAPGGAAMTAAASMLFWRFFPHPIRPRERRLKCVSLSFCPMSRKSTLYCPVRKRKPTRLTPKAALPGPAVVYQAKTKSNRSCPNFVGKHMQARRVSSALKVQASGRTTLHGKN